MLSQKCGRAAVACVNRRRGPSESVCTVFVTSSFVLSEAVWNLFARGGADCVQLGHVRLMFVNRACSCYRGL